METQKVNVTVILAVVVAATVATALVSGLLSTSQTVKNVGNVKAIGLGVFIDRECTTPLTIIDWGDVTANSIHIRSIYLKNLGSVKVKLSMTTGNWTPSIVSSYLNLTWDCENVVLDVGASIKATLTLKVLSNAQGTPFSFDMYITATETQ